MRIEEAVDVLHEQRNATSSALDLLAVSFRSILGERFRQHVDERPVSRKEHAQGFFPGVQFRAVNDVQTGERLPGSWDAGNEANCLRAVRLRRPNDAEYFLSRPRQVVGAGLRPADLSD